MSADECTVGKREREEGTFQWKEKEVDCRQKEVESLVGGCKGIHWVKIDVQWENPYGLKPFWYLCLNADGHELRQKQANTGHVGRSSSKAAKHVS